MAADIAEAAMNEIKKKNQRKLKRKQTNKPEWKQLLFSLVMILAWDVSSQ